MMHIFWYWFSFFFFFLPQYIFHFIFSQDSFFLLPVIYLISSGCCWISFFSLSIWSISDISRGYFFQLCFTLAAISQLHTSSMDKWSQCGLWDGRLWVQIHNWIIPKGCIDWIKQVPAGHLSLGFKPPSALWVWLTPSCRRKSKEHVSHSLWNPYFLWKMFTFIKKYVFVSLIRFIICCYFNLYSLIGSTSGFLTWLFGKLWGCLWKNMWAIKWAPSAIVQRSSSCLKLPLFRIHFETTEWLKAANKSRGAALSLSLLACFLWGSACLGLLAFLFTLDFCHSTRFNKSQELNRKWIRLCCMWPGFVIRSVQREGV